MTLMEVSDSIANEIYTAYQRGFMFLCGLHYKMMKDQSGMAGNIIGIVVIVVVLMLSALILAPLQDQAQNRVTELGNAQANETFADITDASWGALSTASIIPYVIVFMVIIGLIIGLAKRS